MKILIAYDGSASSDTAIEDLERAGLPDQADALVVSVAEVWLPIEEDESQNGETEAAPPPPAIVRQMWAKNELLVKKAKEQAEQAAARLRQIFPTWSIRAEAATGSPTWELLRLDGEWEPDLIVVGSHGHTAIGRLVLGSVSQKLLTEATCTVRIGRTGKRDPQSPVRILIGVDGSAASFAAVQQASERQWPAGSVARLVVVYDLITPTLIGSVLGAVVDTVEEINKSTLDWATQLAEQAKAKIQNSHLSVETAIEAGDPKRLLVSLADEWDADCVFAGSTGVSGRVERILLGSVSSAIAARAKCSVEVVRI